MNNQLQNQEQTAHPPASFQTIGVYGGLTAVILLLLLILSNSLQQYPRFLSTPENKLQPRWQIVTNDAQTITFNMPQRWVWGEKGTDLFDFVAEAGVLQTAVSPFLTIDPNTNITLVALVDETAVEKGVIIVAHSERMRQLTAEQLVQFVIENNIPGIQKAEIIAQPGGNHADLIIEIETEAGLWLCYQRYGQNAQAGHIISGCAARTQLQASSELRQAIASFQPLIWKNIRSQ